MNKLVWLLGCAPFLLAACGDINTAKDDPSDRFIDDLPASVRAMADPSQNLNAVRVDPSDGCFVYKYAGPVETTLLPLRTVDGRPICTRQPEEPTTN